MSPNQHIVAGNTAEAIDREQPKENDTSTPGDGERDEQVKAGREFMHQYRDTFRKLAD